jgi:hypothetical protein
VVPKPVPVIVTASQVFPELGVTDVMLETEETVKLSPLLAVPPAVTPRLPVVAPVGTGTVINTVATTHRRLDAESSVLKTMCRNKGYMTVAGARRFQGIRPQSVYI